MSMVGTWSNVEKRAKRMPDTTVETTKIKNHKAKFFTIRLNHKAQNENMAKSTEFSGKNLAY